MWQSSHPVKAITTTEPKKPDVWICRTFCRSFFTVQRSLLNGKVIYDRLGDAAANETHMEEGSLRAAFFVRRKEKTMARRFLIDRQELPYDAMVSDPAQLIPIDDDDEGGDTDGDQREKADTHSDQGAGGKSGKAKAE